MTKKNIQKNNCKVCCSIREEGHRPLKLKVGMYKNRVENGGIYFLEICGYLLFYISLEWGNPKKYEA